MSESGYRRVVLKTLTLGVLVSCLVLLSNKENLARRQNAAGAGGSAEWGDGYRQGFEHAVGRLKRLLDKSGERQLEAELRRLSSER